MSQETRSPIDVAGEYWATYKAPLPKGPSSIVTPIDEASDLDWAKLINVNPDDVLEAATYPWSAPVSDPWSNGRYALAALAWGLIALVVLGIGAGP